MIYLWDTNILVHRLRKSNTYAQLEENLNFFSPGNQVLLSIISIAEIYSLAYQRQWGPLKLSQLTALISGFRPVPIARQSILDAYVQLDVYSQGKDPLLPLPSGMTARNMGKNDLWIAATAVSLSADLVTLDHDFAHLNGTWLTVHPH